MERNAAVLRSAKIDGSDAAHDGMIWIPRGTFRMGSDKHYRKKRSSRFASTPPRAMWVSEASGEVPDVYT